MQARAREERRSSKGETVEPVPVPASAPHPDALLALQQGVGNAGVAAMLDRRRKSIARAHDGSAASARKPSTAQRNPAVLQRAPEVEYTPAPYRFPLGETRLLPPTKPVRKDFVPEVRVQRPLAEGSFAVAGVPVGYELKTDAELRAGIEFGSSAVMLTDIDLMAYGAEADRMRERPSLIPGLRIPGIDDAAPSATGPRPEPRGRLGGSARLRFDAVVNLDASASAGLSGGVTAGLNAFAAGAYGRIRGAASAAAMLTGDNMIFLNWNDGQISLESAEVTGFWLSFDLDFKVTAEAGVYVELRVPEVPVVTDLYNEIESWPGVGWFLPDLKSLHWREEYGKSWELAAKRYRHSIPVGLKLGEDNSVEPVLETKHGPGPDAMLDDAGREQKQQLRDDPKGPGDERLKGDPGSLADATAAAKAQLASTREILEREKSVTAELLGDARRRRPKTASARPADAQTAGIQIAGIDPPGIGPPGGKTDDAVDQLERREDELKATESRFKDLKDGAAGMHEPAADDDGPTRNKARLGLEMVAKNADALGDQVNKGEGDLARPTQTGDPADASALAELDRVEPALLALLDEASDAIRMERERLGALPRPSMARSAGTYREAHEVYRSAITEAAAQRVKLANKVEAAQKLRIDRPAAALTRLTALREPADRLRASAAALAPLRPHAPPPASWFGFKPELNDAFRERLATFRGTGDLAPTHQGGEGAVFRDHGDLFVLKRWFGKRLGDMGRSVRLLKATRAAVERDAVLSQYVRVVAIHEEGPDWILRDWVTARQTVAQAGGAQDAVSAVVEAIGRLEASGGLSDELRLLRTRIRERSENLRWDGAQIVVVDLM